MLPYVGNMALRSRKAMSVGVHNPSHLLPFTSLLYFRTDHSVPTYLIFHGDALVQPLLSVFLPNICKVPPPYSFAVKKKLGVTLFCCNARVQPLLPLLPRVCVTLPPFSLMNQRDILAK